MRLNNQLFEKKSFKYVDRLQKYLNFFIRIDERSSMKDKHTLRNVVLGLISALLGNGAILISPYRNLCLTTLFS